MSRAFTKEDAQQEDVMVVARPPLPEGEPNLVTPNGMRLLREEEQALAEGLVAAAASGNERRTAALQAASDDLALRLSTAVVVDPAEHDKSQVRFGDRVTLRSANASTAGGFSLRIVGVDEADPDEGLISFLAPLARELIGKNVGQRVALGADATGREFVVVAIE